MQDEFLKALVEARVPVTLYLLNGIRLLGQIESFDQYGVVLGGASQQFIFKHAISTIVPAREATPASGPSSSAPLEETDAPPQKTKTLTRRPKP